MTTAERSRLARTWDSVVFRGFPVQTLLLVAGAALVLGVIIGFALSLLDAPGNGIGVSSVLGGLVPNTSEVPGQGGR